MESIRQIITDRPVAILLPGSSLERQGWSKYCLATVNHYWLLEEAFGIKFDILLASAKENDLEIDKYRDFVSRDNVCLFSTNLISGKNIYHFQTDVPNVVRKVPSQDEPLAFRALASFAILIFLLTIAGAREIHLFGADGGEIDGKLYWGQWPSDSKGRLDMDTLIINQAFPIIMKRVCSLYKIEQPTILNHSLKSHYTCFKKCP